MKIKRLFVDRAVQYEAAVQAVRARLPEVPCELVDDAAAVYHCVNDAPDPVGAGKQMLLLTRNKGAFVRNCPGTREYTCCGYQILHMGTYCTMDCAYCILQSYFHPPLMQYFVNHADLFSDLDRTFSRDTISRIGTGEFTDSLIWTSWTDLVAQLVNTFAGQHRAVLELKSKAVSIAPLKSIDHRRKTIMAWSLNTEKIIRNEERHTAGLAARLRAAKTCEALGYPLAFHFDPMILYPGCEADYRRVVERLFTAVSADNIVWISMGTFRFMPDLKPIVAQRFPSSSIVYGEFIPGLDGKMRYFKPLRIQLLKKMASWIRELAPQVFVYLCMEDDAVWRKALGYIPAERGGLPHLLDQCAMRHCGVEAGDQGPEVRGQRRK